MYTWIISQKKHEKVSFSCVIFNQKNINIKKIE